MKNFDHSRLRTRNRYIWNLAFAFTVAVAVVLTSGCAPDSPSTSEEPEAAERGKLLFATNCGACHGLNGRGPALAEIKALSSAERRERIRNHPIAGEIPQRLPANELSDVIEFLE